MAKLYYKYSCMAGGKTLDLIRAIYNYRERNMKALAFKPRIDTRDGEEDCIIKSRTGSFCEGIWIDNDENIYEKVKNYLTQIDIDIIVIDEVQFLSEEQIMQLSDIVTEIGISVLAYGLKTNFRGELFKSIAVLLAYCDDIQEIRCVCFCGKRATQNARVINGKIVKTGEEILIGGNETYVALCNKHFKEGELGGGLNVEL